MLAVLLTALESEKDREKFIEIYEQYHAQMERTAMRILKEQSDIEDAVQNAFMQVILHFEKIFEIPCEELPFWIISIVKNEAQMILRKNKRTVPLEEWEGFSKSIDEITGYTELVDLITRLPETYRAVLEMKMLLGYSDKEISKHLSISETAVSSRATRGRTLLRKIAEQEGFYP
jgi:RNA polymerase sigma-70 factor (ECF subfamily)